MAVTFTFADLQAAWPQLYRELVPLINRKVPTLRVLPIKPTVTGQNIGWDVTFKGQSAAAVNLDGGNFVTATADQRVAATLSHGSYSAPIKVTDKAQLLGSVTPVINGFDAFSNLLGQNLSEAINALVKLLGQQLYVGSGTANQMNGLSQAAVATGSYANINQSSFSDWAAYIDSNGGTLRNLALAMIKKAARTIAVANQPYGRPDVCFTTPALMDSLEALFDAYTRVVYDPSSGSVSMPGGAGERVTMNPPVITTAGGRINADGFRAFRWENQGITFIEDPDCQHTGFTNSTNVMILACSAALECEFVPPAGDPMSATMERDVQAVEQIMGPIANLRFQMKARGRVDWSDQWDLSSMISLKCKARNALGVIADVQ
ncbi:MAG TPA: hypothetical protein VJ891_09635 [Casimicrobiaceae bacterium]|nr:hypothetical protein [Casimicrobiaceae bacterium]